MRKNYGLLKKKGVAYNPNRDIILFEKLPTDYIMSTEYRNKNMEKSATHKI